MQKEATNNEKDLRELLAEFAEKHNAVLCPNTAYFDLLLSSLQHSREQYGRAICPLFSNIAPVFNSVCPCQEAEKALKACGHCATYLFVRRDCINEVCKDAEYAKREQRRTQKQNCK